jgi:hypothetical protein
VVLTEAYRLLSPEKENTGAVEFFYKYTPAVFRSGTDRASALARGNSEAVLKTLPVAS